mgnify:CR=1 FL=1
MTEREEQIVQRLRQEKGAREERQRKAARKEQIELVGKALLEYRAQQEQERRELIGEVTRDPELVSPLRFIERLREIESKTPAQFFDKRTQERVIVMATGSIVPQSFSLRRTQEAEQRLRTWQEIDDARNGAFTAQQQVFATSTVAPIMGSFGVGPNFTSPRLYPTREEPTPLDPPPCPTPTARRILFIADEKEK